MIARDWGDAVFPAASALLAGFLAYHALLGHRTTPPKPPAGGEPVADTAVLRPLRLPVALPTLLVDEDPDDFVDLAYDGVLTLHEGGLRLGAAWSLSPGSGPTNNALLDSAFAGGARVRSITLALAERTPYGWRIARAGERWDAWPPDSSMGGRFTPGGWQLMHRPDSLRLPGVTASDLVGRWPVVVHELELLDRTTYEITRVQVFARGDPMTFPLLLQPPPWETAEER